LNELPDTLLSIKFLKLEEESERGVENILQQIDESINSFLGRRIANQEKAQEFKEQIESNAPGYITETLEELAAREKYQRNIALLWYVVGFLSICSGVAVAVLFANN